MALVRELELVTFDHGSPHTETNATYSIVTAGDGQRLLQIDTYGSAARQIPGKKSQTIRFAPEAIEQLRRILREEL